MIDQWYYGENGQQRGPISLAAMRDRIAAGLTRGDDLVWREGMAAWTAASAVPELADVAVAVPAAGALPQPGYARQPGPGPIGYYAPAFVDSQYVGFWWRVLSYLIDYIITYIVGLPIGFAAGFVIGMANGNNQNTQIAAQIIGGLIGFILTWLYFALMESSTQQATLGKMAIGVRVTDMYGNRISFGRASGRFFGKILSSLIIGIGYIMVAFTEKKQGLHDILASTVVLKGRPNGDARGFPLQQ